MRTRENRAPRVIEATNGDFVFVGAPVPPNVLAKLSLRNGQMAVHLPRAAVMEAVRALALENSLV